ncbi:helix-turn-helix transcriptional regulator [Ferrovibrio sp.]|uniref:helix-turn-helix domain-containing protein n=1 Tax=Ferrovibrio sp. TaxID=1917215 RepID=UPI00262EBC40|nr:helix-turn-helix transcriptional regulator [Ferrovibrio sp.]
MTATAAPLQGPHALSILPQASIAMLCRPQRRQGKLFYPAGMQLCFADICHARGLTLEQLATRLIMTRDSLVAILHGAREVPPGLAASLAQALTAAPEQARP